MDFDFLKKADYAARVYVNGLRATVGTDGVVHDDQPRIAHGEFTEEFMRHRWVRKAIVEGWGGQLRQHCIRVVREAIARGNRKPSVEECMPDLATAEYWSTQAKKYDAAMRWKRDMAEKHGTFDAYLRAHKPTYGAAETAEQGS
jgi:hypothetical protein